MLLEKPRQMLQPKKGTFGLSDWTSMINQRIWNDIRFPKHSVVQFVIR